MKQEPKRALIDYRIEKAKEAFKDAQLLKEHGRWNASINRLYYCCFYCCSAVLLQQGLDANTHKGLKSQFNEHFIKNGIFDKSYAILVSNLFNWRQKGDYDDMFDASSEIVESTILDVEKFINTCEKFISSNR